MAIQKSTDLRDAQNDAWETILGTSPILEFRSGAQPANCAAADSGTLVASMTLPSDHMGASSGGVKSKLGTWEDPAADNANAGGSMHFRLKTSGGTCKAQGTVTATGGGGDITIDNMNIAAGQKITITSFSITASGA
jgi:hypothetical protein